MEKGLKALGICLQSIIRLFGILWLSLLMASSSAAAPNPPALVAPVDNASSVSLSPTLSAGVSSPAGAPMAVKFYGRRAIDPIFRIIVLPDTQNAAQFYPSVFTAQTQWIVNNKIALNIAFVAHVGDVVNTCTSTAQYNNADAAMDLLDSGNVLYGVSPGNHDQPNSGSCGSTSQYPNYFGTSRFSGKPYYGGRLDDYNHYFIFSAGGMDFIIVFLQYNPATAQLDWVDALLKANPRRRGIVVSHNILNIDDSWSFPSIYENLKDNSNLFLMLCGHMHSPTDGEALRTDTYNGNTVFSILSDYQDFPNGGSGWLRMLEIDPYAGQINVKAYSPYLGQTGTSFSLSYNMFQLLGTDAAVASGSTASLTWPAPTLSALTEYEWYVTVNDATGTTTGPIWSFTTGTGTALVGDFAPSDCDVDGSDLAALIGDFTLVELTDFAGNFGLSTCL